EFYADGRIATKFLSNGSWDRGDADKEKMVSDMVDDQVDTIGKAFMGLTLGCARCHNHKFDPLSQDDYYALAGMFYSTHILKELGTKGGEYTLNRVPLVPKSYVTKRDQQVQELKKITAKLAELDQKSPKPATAIVIGNRVWQGHLGARLVRTPNNFGMLSESPSHPALLDWLTSRFVEDGWSLKKLHRRIMLSATYQQSRVVARDQLSRDPE